MSIWEIANLTETREPATRIAKVGSVESLARTINRGSADVAVYQAPPVAFVGELQRFQPALMREFDIAIASLQEVSVTKSKDSFASAAYNLKTGAQWHLATEAEIRAFGQMVDLLFADLCALVQKFPKYRIGAMFVKGADDSVTARNTKWHRDRHEDGSPNQQINIVRTYFGPSTEFAQSESGTGEQRFAHGSISAHNDVAWHRGPAYNKSVPRFGVAIRLEPIK